MLELCGEPLYIISSTRLEFGTRASIDTAAMICKCLVTLLLVSRTGLAPALAFAAAQLVFSGVVLLGYGRYGLQLWRQVRGGVRLLVLLWVVLCGSYDLCLRCVCSCVAAIGGVVVGRE